MSNYDDIKAERDRLLQELRDIDEKAEEELNLLEREANREYRRYIVDRDREDRERQQKIRERDEKLGFFLFITMPVFLMIIAFIVYLFFLFDISLTTIEAVNSL